MAAPPEPRWLMLIHQIPPSPGYFRVKIWRRLQRLGAVAIKSSVYVLPRTDQAHEDLEWLLREIVDGGGDASVCEARFVHGLTVAQIEDLFRAARDADYAQLAGEIRALAEAIPRKRAARSKAAELAAEVRRLRRRFVEIAAIDFLGAPGREACDGLLAGAEKRLAVAAAETVPRRASRDEYRGRTWVTRKGIHVDRIASAWVIRRFIDPRARFKFVAPKGYTPLRGELRFDMFEAELTHEGDRCTFEVLLERFALRDRALEQIAEIVHDIDFKDGKFERPDAAGVERLIAGICLDGKDDEARLARGSSVFEDLYRYFGRKQD